MFLVSYGKNIKIKSALLIWYRELMHQTYQIEARSILHHQLIIEPPIVILILESNSGKGHKVLIKGKNIELNFVSYFHTFPRSIFEKFFIGGISYYDPSQDMESG